MQKPLIAVLIASAFLTLNAQAADLLQVYQQALANDATSPAPALRLPPVRNASPGALRPAATIAASGSNLRNNGDITQGGSGGFAPAAPPTTTPTPTRSCQPLFNWGAWQTYQQSKLSQATAEATFSQAQQDLIVRVAQAFSTC
jgi:outer membrane protein